MNPPKWSTIILKRDEYIAIQRNVNNVYECIYFSILFHSKQSVLLLRWTEYWCWYASITKCIDTMVENEKKSHLNAAAILDGFSSVCNESMNSIKWNKNFVYFRFLTRFIFQTVFIYFNFSKYSFYISEINEYRDNVQSNVFAVVVIFRAAFKNRCTRMDYSCNNKQEEWKLQLKPMALLLG